MSDLKASTYTLQVHIHCDGCTKKVKKTLTKITGVYKVDVDPEQSEVTVVGNVDPQILIKKLKKCGKPARILSAPNNESPIQKDDKGGDNKNKSPKDGEGDSGLSCAGGGHKKKKVIVADSESDDDE